MADPLATASLGSTRSLAGDGDGTRILSHKGHPTNTFDGGPPDASIADLSPDSLPAGYLLLSEIARGGMGRIVAGRDLSLDREVAIKLLLPGTTTADGIRRFIREAKITGQLPHPGIPPVHALGTLANGRPFLSMKLIRGRTLADDLAERKSPTDDLPRFLQVFEQICQAVGFAHSQGVIHRDLKPANIMVGAFAETQVMDWGLAKRLNEDDEPTSDEAGSDNENWTRTGAVLGTPAYMSPEQARGGTKDVDARADVFALGTILCEILTGQRAFTGRTSHDVLKQAAAADLTGAFQRLESAGADAELTSIAKECLAASPDDRPSDAAVVSKRMADHRIGVEVRLRKAEADRAAAEVEAKEQRKRRRVQLALTAAVLLLILGGGAYAWTAERRAAVERERVAQNVAAINSLLDRAEDSLREDDAQAASVLLVEAERRMAEPGAASLQEQFRRIVRDRDLLVELDDVDEFRWRNTEEGGLPRPEEVVARWSAALQRIDVKPGTDSAAAVDASIIRLRILRTLDLWLTRVKRPERAPVFALVAAIDPDPWRNSVRGAWTRGEADKFAAAVEKPESLRQPAHFAAALGGMFGHVSPEKRKAIMVAACIANPRDFGLHMESAFAHLGPGNAYVGDGAQWYRAAATIRPKSVRAWVQLGIELSSPARKENKAAIAALERAVSLDPNDASARVWLAAALRFDGERIRAADVLHEAIRIRPKWDMPRTELCVCLLASNDLPAALAAAQGAIAANPTLPVGYYYRSIVEAKSGNHAAVIASLDEAIRLNSKIVVYHTARGDSHRDMKQWKAAAKDYTNATKLDPSNSGIWFQLGWACLNGGDPDGGIQAFRELVKLTPNDPWAHGNLGVSLCAKGQYSAAADCYREVVRLDPRSAKFRIEFGNILVDKGDPESAMLEFRIALQLEPASAAAMDGLARAIAAMKK